MLDERRVGAVKDTLAHPIDSAAVLPKTFSVAEDPGRAGHAGLSLGRDILPHAYMTLSC
jgi:hypothetical protein